MPLGKSVHKFKGMVKDIAKESYSPEYYFDARNLKVISIDTQDSFAISNEKGTSLEFRIPIITGKTLQGGNTKIDFISSSNITTNSPLLYSWEHDELTSIDITNIHHKIIGYTTIEQFIIIITTNDAGVDCIWKIWMDYTILANPHWHIDLVYLNNLGLSSLNPPELKIRYDSIEFIKLYFTDFINQLRHISLTDNTVHNLRASFLDIVPQFAMSQPTITAKNWGGLHTSGMIQYAYNLYNVSGSQTKMSPPSNLVYLATSTRGGEVNEVIGQTNTIQIDNIDTDYDSIKVYSIKYTSYAQEPIVSVIADNRIVSSIMTFYDDGKPNYDISLEEFLFLGGDPIYVETMETKYNRLFLGNYKTGNFDVDNVDSGEYFDARAFSFSPSGICSLTHGGDTHNYLDPINQVPRDYDSINANYDLYKYRNGVYTGLIGGKYTKLSGLGGTGKYINYYLYQRDSAELTEGDPEELKFLKSREIYRIAIEFYNSLGQYSLPKWIADFKVPHGNLNGYYNILEVELTPAAITYLQAHDVVGWRVLRARRDVTDMTIVSQGMVNPTIYQITDTGYFTSTLAGQPDALAGWAENFVKMPTTFTRTFDDYIEPHVGGSTPNLTVNKILNDHMAFTYAGANSDNHFGTEIFTEHSHGVLAYRKHLTYVYSKLNTFYSPEVLFREALNLETSLNLNPIGTYKTQSNKVWGKNIDTNNRYTHLESRNNFGLSVFTTSSGAMHDYGLIGQAGLYSDNRTEFYQYFRTFSNFVLGHNWDEDITLLDFPKISESNGSEIYYDNNSGLRFWNSLYTIISDQRKIGGLFTDDPEGLRGVNSCGTKTLVWAELSQKSLEDLYEDSHGVHTTTGLPIAELSRTLFNQYGGNTYEAKKRTFYLRIGGYNTISTTNHIIENAGDIFVQPFRFTRIVPISKDVFDTRFTQYTEVVEFPVETIIDLKNRNDYSNNDWDSKFQPLEIESHQYNEVYSQESDWFMTKDLEYTFKETELFDNAILPTKIKTDNELIDSWTDILYNSEMKLDGTYGPIKKLISHNDNMIAFQPKATAILSISPRVQTIAEDGVSIELGKGDILHEYKYLTTTSGCINKYSILSTQSGLYYYDALNNILNVLGEGKVDPISKLKGMNTDFKNKIDLKTVQIDNPFIGRGLWLGNDPINDQILIVSNTDKGVFTLCYGENTGQFTDYVDYHPKLMIHYNDMFLIDNLESIYSLYTGDYNNYFGTVYPSKITLLANIGNPDNIFNVLEYRSETYLGNTEVPNHTFTKFRLYNEYQNTGIKNTIRETNLFKKFRTWRIVVPRDITKKLDRIRGPWTFIELEMLPTKNYKFICHNITVYFEDATIKA